MCNLILFWKIKKRRRCMCLCICVFLYEHRESYRRIVKVDYFWGGGIGWGWRDNLYISF